MRRSNPEQYIIDLRAEYRAEYGNDWWKDEEIKAQFKEDRSAARAASQGKAPKKKSKSTKTTKKTSAKRKSTKVTDMLDPKLRRAIDVAQTALEELFPNRTFEVNEDYGGGGTVVVFSEGDDHTISVELSPKRKYVHYQATIEEHMDGVQGGIFRTANGVVEKDNLPGDLDLLADSMGLFESMNTDLENTMKELRRQSGKKPKKTPKKSKKRASKQKDKGLSVTVMYGGKSKELKPGSKLYKEYVDLFLNMGTKSKK